jgi:hypothetical protein
MIYLLKSIPSVFEISLEVTIHNSLLIGAREAFFSLQSSKELVKPRGMFSSPIIIRHHRASSGITEHHQASPSIIRDHRASSGITEHHQASPSIIRHH